MKRNEKSKHWKADENESLTHLKKNGDRFLMDFDCLMAGNLKRYVSLNSSRRQS